MSLNSNLACGIKMMKSKKGEGQGGGTEHLRMGDQGGDSLIINGKFYLLQASLSTKSYMVMIMSSFG